MWWVGHCKVCLHCGQDITEFVSVVGRTSGSLSLWWVGHLGVFLCGGQDIAEFVCGVQNIAEFVSMVGRT